MTRQTPSSCLFSNESKLFWSGLRMLKNAHFFKAGQDVKTAWKKFASRNLCNVF